MLAKELRAQFHHLKDILKEDEGCDKSVFHVRAKQRGAEWS